MRIRSERSSEICNIKKGLGSKDALYKIELLMKQAEISPADRKVAVAAMEVENQTHQPAVAIELDDGSIIDGKTSDLLSAPAAALLNVLKELADLSSPPFTSIGIISILF